MPPTNHPYRVLIIEDDADARDNLTDILELDNFDVTTAGTAAEALSRCDWAQVSVVLLDRKLPDANALELLPRLKELAPAATFVVVTGMADLDGAITALRFGAADYILKPINVDALRASLSRIVERLRTEGALADSQRRLELERQRALQNERLAAIGETMTALIHESRNALQRSKACLEMLALEVQDRPRAVELVLRVQKAQDDMQELYEEVRQYAAPINLRRAVCNLRKLWQDVWQNLSLLHQEKQLRLQEETGDIDLCIDADEFALGQVLRNILENAIAASPQPGLITIQASSAEINGQQAVRIVITDQGPGLTDEQMDRIFTPFFTTKSKGTGLGLAISQRIVQSHHGHISAANAEAGGAAIEVILPRVQT